MRPRPPRPKPSRSAAPAPGSAPPPSISKAGSARPRRAVHGFTVGALAAVNAAGSVTVGRGPWFWAAPYEQGGEFGGLGLPSPLPADALAFPTKGRPGENTTLVVVACDAALTKTQAQRLAIMAQVGLARAIRPVHTPLDGDLVFAAATGSRPLADPIADLAELGAVAADVVGPRHCPRRLRGRALPFPQARPDWRHSFAPASAH